MQRVRVGITIGDINSISPEVIIKGLYDKRMLEQCIPVIYGSAKVVSYHKNVVDLSDFTFNSLRSAERLHQRKVNVVNCWEDTVNISLGRPTEEGGKYAYIALDRAVRDLKEGLIDALVTGPVNKHAMQLVNFPAPGHTEYLERELQGDALMLMVSDTLKVGLVTGHIPVSEISQQIDADKVRRKLDLFLNSLTQDFGLEKPTIAVLGLNPHASDEGLMGTEEEEIIRPLINTYKNNGHLIMGPYPADGFFGSGEHTKFDGILAMYHDQGLIPFKTLSFGQGVNYTAGLEYVRTSPDHGTAYQLAGKNEADAHSFRSALYLAIDIFRSRSLYNEIHSREMKKEPKLSEENIESEN